MVLPRLTHRVRIVTPAPPVIDPATGLPTAPAPEDVVVPGRLSQAPIGNVSDSTELRARQDTTVSEWSLLVRAETVLTSASIVTDIDSGRRFQVVGEPADRPDRRPRFRAAPLRLISDMQ